ncbi:unnamed protein product [Symbiodinium microadriaticum]|nr:unnamed protein product [Symbiodinium microadriaticum]
MNDCSFPGSQTLRSASLYKELGDQTGEADSLLQLTVAQLEAERPEDAMPTARAAHDLCKKVSDMRRCALAQELVQLAQTFDKQFKSGLWAPSGKGLTAKIASGMGGEEVRLHRWMPPPNSSEYMAKEEQGQHKVMQDRKFGAKLPFQRKPFPWITPKEKEKPADPEPEPVAVSETAEAKVAGSGFDWSLTISQPAPPGGMEGYWRCERCGVLFEDPSEGARADADGNFEWFCRSCWRDWVDEHLRRARAAKEAGVSTSQHGGKGGGRALKAKPTEQRQTETKPARPLPSRQELQQLSLIELYKHARSSGADFKLLSIAMNSDNPKTGLLELLAPTCKAFQILFSPSRIAVDASAPCRWSLSPPAMLFPGKNHKRPGRPVTALSASWSSVNVWRGARNPCTGLARLYSNLDPALVRSVPLSACLASWGRPFRNEYEGMNRADAMVNPYLEPACNNCGTHPHENDFWLGLPHSICASDTSCTSAPHMLDTLRKWHAGGSVGPKRYADTMVLPFLEPAGDNCSTWDREWMTAKSATLSCALKTLCTPRLWDVCHIAQVACWRGHAPSEREKRVTSTQGATAYQQAVGLEILLRGYRGKQFPDATSESPGADLEDELTPVKKVVQPRAPRAQGDCWVVTETMVIRKHGNLAGKRRTDPVALS